MNVSPLIRYLAELLVEERDSAAVDLDADPTDNRPRHERRHLCEVLDRQAAGNVDRRPVACLSLARRTSSIRNRRRPRG